MTRIGEAIQAKSLELRTRLSRRATIRDMGRCATCPWVVGAQVLPPGRRSLSDCPDYGTAEFNERLPLPSVTAPHYMDDPIAVSYCKRNEAAISNAIVIRQAPVLPWREIARRSLYVVAAHVWANWEESSRVLMQAGLPHGFGTPFLEVPQPLPPAPHPTRTDAPPS